MPCVPVIIKIIIIVIIITAVIIINTFIIANAVLLSDEEDAAVERTNISVRLSIANNNTS